MARVLRALGFVFLMSAPNLLASRENGKASRPKVNKVIRKMSREARQDLVTLVALTFVRIDQPSSAAIQAVGARSAEAFVVASEQHASAVRAGTEAGNGELSQEHQRYADSLYAARLQAQRARDYDPLVLAARYASGAVVATEFRNALDRSGLGAFLNEVRPAANPLQHPARTATEQGLSVRDIVGATWQSNSVFAEATESFVRAQAARHRVQIEAATLYRMLLELTSSLAAFQLQMMNPGVQEEITSFYGNLFRQAGLLNDRTVLAEFDRLEIRTRLAEQGYVLPRQMVSSPPPEFNLEPGWSDPFDVDFSDLTSYPEVEEGNPFAFCNFPEATLRQLASQYAKRIRRRG